MSSISLSHPHGFPSSSDSSAYSFPSYDGEQAPSTSSHFTTPSSSSFAINPASSLPPPSSLPPQSPRKPRATKTSLISGQTLHFSEKDLLDEDEPEEVTVIGGGLSAPNGGPRPVEVWKDILLTADGRDKAFKLIQYSIKVYLLFHARTTYALGKPASPWEADILKRLQSTASGFSLTRKCLILFNWLAPLNSITAPQSLSSYSSRGKTRQQPLLYKFLHAPPPVLLDLLTSLSDDVHTFHRLGLVPRRIGQRAGKLADWFWFAGTLVGLVEVGVERGMVGGLIAEIEARMYESNMGNPGTATAAQTAADEAELAKLKRQYAWLQVTRAKLFMDLIFVSYEVFKIRRYAEPAQALSGLMAAILSGFKIYDKHRTNLTKAS